MPNMTYRQKLRDPRWQQVRLRVFERDGWRCQRAGCRSPEFTPLAVHHRRYLTGLEPWEYPASDLITFCEQCHNLQHNLTTTRLLSEDQGYPWGALPALLGFEPQPYLTQREGQIVCACIKLEYNPDAPAILLPGDTDEIIARSELFAGQTQLIPIFIKARNGRWEYRGHWRVDAVTTNTAEIALHRRVHKLRHIPISMVLFMTSESSVVGPSPLDLGKPKSI